MRTSSATGLVRQKVRNRLVREYDLARAFPEPVLLIGMIIGAAVASAGLVVIFGLVYLGVSVRRRRVADEATELSWLARLGLAVLGVVPVIVSVVQVWTVSVKSRDSAVSSANPAYICLVLLAPILLPLIAVRWSRRPGARGVTAWRGNLRRVLPLTMLCCAAMAIVLVGRRAAGTKRLGEPVHPAPCH